MPRLATRYPLTEFDPGAGLPVITRHGVLVTPDEDVAIRAAAAARGIVLVALDLMGTPAPAVPPMEVLAPEGYPSYVERRFADLQKSLSALGGGSTVKAAVNLSSPRVVAVRSDGARYADPATPSDMWSACAVTTTAAIAGDEVGILANGEMTEPGWTWTPGSPVYVGVGGTLTQVAPTRPSALWLRVAGVATSPTELLVQFGVPITLA